MPDGQRVLVIDDNRTSLEILSNALVSLRFDVTAVDSGADALALLTASCGSDKGFDVVLTDYLMPDMDGIEVTRRIKDLARLQRPPTVVMVTAQDRDEIAQLAWAAGVDAFLTKPVTPSQLLNTIQQVLGRHVSCCRRPSTAATASFLPPARARLAETRILLVEDNDINRELALEVLARSNLTVDTAADGAEAIRMVQTGDYDTVLMDCQMPVMDGYTATRILRQDQRFSALPIIAMTANAMAGDREECLAAGMNDYIAKPFDEIDLLDVLSRWIRKAPLSPQHASPATAPMADDRMAGLTRINVDDGLRHASDNVTLFRRLLIRFADQQGAFEETFRAAVAANNQDQAIRLAHTLKGLAANLGARAVNATVTELERALRDTLDPAAVEPYLARVVAELTPLLAELRTLHTPGAVKEDMHVSSSGLVAPREVMSKLAAMLKAGDVESNECLAALLHQWPGIAPRLEAVRKLASDYRFEEAAAALGSVMELA
jgi:CheY-like chemotaxis protein